MTNIIAHHGSPGTPQDFNLLELNLKGVNFKKTERYLKDNILNDDSEDIQLGYSYGCVAAIKRAIVKKSNTLILISPYIFINELSLIKKKVLTIPFIGNTLIKKISRSAINKMLIDSSYPHKVSHEYKACSIKYLDVKVLKHALLEKTTKDHEIKNDLKSLIKIRQK